MSISKFKELKGADKEGKFTNCPWEMHHYQIV